MKNITKLVLFICALFLINGCSNKQETNKEESKIVNTQEIKVTENAVKNRPPQRKNQKMGESFIMAIMKQIK